MLFGAIANDLELRRASDGTVRLKGRFPYNATAVLSDGGRTGRPRKERIASKAFAYRVEKQDENIHLLSGHDYSKPLASREAGTLKLADTEEALTFDATITPQIAATSYGVDVIAGIEAGLAIGLSPGFRIPPERAVKDAEKITQEAVDPAKGMHGAIIRTIMAALLFELSIVTAPAYPEAQVEARNWNPSDLREPDDAGVRRVLNRWRA